MGLPHDSPYQHAPELGLYIGIGLQSDFHRVARALAGEGEVELARDGLHELLTDSGGEGLEGGGVHGGRESGQQGDEAGPQPRLGGGGIVVNARPKQRWRVGQKSRMRDFRREVQLKIGRGDRMPFRFHVVVEGSDHRRCVQHARLVGLPEIEEITSLAALIKCPQFGAKKLRGGIDRQVGRTGEPTGSDGEIRFLKRQEAQMFACVDLDLQPKPDHGGKFGLKPVSEGGPARTDIAPGFPQPGIQAQPEAIQSIANRLLPELNKVQILRIAGGGLKDDFVQGGAAAEEQAVAQDRIGVDLDKSA